MREQEINALEELWLINGANISNKPIIGNTLELTNQFRRGITHNNHKINYIRG
jgi:hypothetical protein